MHARAGPGAFDFKQGDTNGTLFWRVVRHFLKEPSEEQVACQAPKPILLDTGSVHIPYEWCARPGPLLCDLMPSHDAASGMHLQCSRGLL
jgi:hypothetical protein